MTEKDLKKMKHFLGNKNDSDMEEVISYIQKKEQKLHNFKLCLIKSTG